LWYLLFALVYFRFAQKPPIPQPEERDNQADREQ
jgi:hypothetical protein